MIVRCSQCSTEFDLDPRQVGPEGVTLRCSVCSHMFHAEPNPDAVPPEPWQVCDVDNRLHSFADLGALIEAIEDGRFRPDDQISRTGRHWLRLGELPELSSVFVGFDGLPRVFRAIEVAAPPAELGPPPAFGDLGPPPPFGEESRLTRVADAGSGLRPAPAGPASMLEAVTKAVAGPGPSQLFRPSTVEPEADAPVAARREVRSEPILMPDTTTAGQIPRTSTRPAEESLPTPAPSSLSEPSATETAHVATVAPPAAASTTEKKGSGAWLGILAIAAGVAIVFGVPSVRAKVFGPAPAPIEGTVEIPSIAGDLALADQSIRGLGLADTDRAQKALQKAIDERKDKGWPVDDLRLAQAELIFTRALAFRIAASLDPTAVAGTAKSRAQEDASWAGDLVAELDSARVSDRSRWGRVQGLLALVDGRAADALAALPPTGADELKLWATAAPLWLNADAPVPAGLIGGLQMLPGPSTLSLALQALALRRAGDLDGARAALGRARTGVADQPLVMTLEPLLRASESVDEATAEGGEAPAESAEGGEGGGGGEDVRRPRPGTSGGGGDASDSGPEGLVARGCEAAEKGDAKEGVTLLLRAIDRGQKGLGVNLCLGAGYMRMANLGSALAFYERGLSIDGSNRDALAGAALAAERFGRKQKAIEYYKRLLAIEPGNEAAQAYLSKNGVAVQAPPSTTSAGPGADTGDAEEPLPEMLKPKPPEDEVLMPIPGKPDP